MSRSRVRIEEGKLILQKKIWSFNDKALFQEFHLVDHVQETRAERRIISEFRKLISLAPSCGVSS